MCNYYIPTHQPHETPPALYIPSRGSSSSKKTYRFNTRRHTMAPNGHLNGWVNHKPDPELHKIRPNSLYLTFNAPQVDEYVSTSLPPLPRVPTNNTASWTISHLSAFKRRTGPHFLRNTLARILYHRALPNMGSREPSRQRPFTF